MPNRVTGSSRLDVMPQLVGALPDLLHFAVGFPSVATAQGCRADGQCAL